MYLSICAECAYWTHTYAKSPTNTANTVWVLRCRSLEGNLLVISYLAINHCTHPTGVEGKQTRQVAGAACVLMSALSHGQTDMAESVSSGTEFLQWTNCRTCCRNKLRHCSLDPSQPKCPVKLKDREAQGMPIFTIRQTVVS